jgi:hypothetical protein
MDPVLLQLLAARASSTGNSQLAEAVARMKSPEGEASLPDPHELLARYGNDNPAVKLLIQQMMARQEAAGPGAGRIIEGKIADHAYETEEDLNQEFAAEGASEALQELRREIEAASAELALCRERNNLLAAALGACCFCWGQDRSCLSCRGRGVPGFSRPDEDLFREYVAPAVRTLRALKMSERSAPN